MGADALDQMAAVELSAEALAPHIAASAQFKLDVAQDDLRDTGKRQMLNLGHSIGHALEGALLEGHTKVSHGWAVAWGMVVESRIASLMDLCEDNANAPLRQAVEGHFPALTLTDNQVAHALTLLAHDKKNVGGEIVMSLPLQPGSIALQKAVPLAVAERALREIMCA